MTWNRRSFLAGLGTAALGWAAGGRLLGASVAQGVGTRVAAFPGRTLTRPLDAIGVQLYTLRRAMGQDMPGTLARVADIGYREVEFAGTFGRTPAEVRALLADHGLSAPSTHIGYNALGGEWQRTLEEAARIGHRWVTIPSLPGELRRTRDGWRRIAEAFNRGGEAARAAGLRLAFHNHAAEFEEIDGVVGFDGLLADTDAALVDFQMDVYWTVRAGRDPLAYLTAHPGRFRMLHLKDSAGPPEHRMVDVGAGAIDWPRLLEAAEAAGVRHYFVEHDNPQDELASVRASYAYLSSGTTPASGP